MSGTTKNPLVEDANKKLHTVQLHTSWSYLVNWRSCLIDMGLEGSVKDAGCSWSVLLSIKYIISRPRDFSLMLAIKVESTVRNVNRMFGTRVGVELIKLTSRTIMKINSS